MKCPECGRESETLSPIASNIFACPFCGESFCPDGSERDSIAEAFEKIIDMYGVEILSDTSRTNALLMDLAPRSVKERKLIRNVMLEGAVGHISALSGKTAEEFEFELRKLIAILSEELWITRDAAGYAVRILARALKVGEFAVLNDTASATADATEAVGDVFAKETITQSSLTVRNSAVKYKQFAANENLTDIMLSDSVRSIYPKAFVNCINLKSIRLPGTLEEIGRCPFEGCSSLEKIEVNDNPTYLVKNGLLTDNRSEAVLFSVGGETVSVPDGIKIIRRKACELRKSIRITLPQTLREIEPDAFYLMYELEAFDVADENTEFCSPDGVLYSKDKKTLIKYPQNKKDIGYITEDETEIISVRAFEYSLCLRTITFTSSLREIGAKAFEGCANLERFMLPMDLEIIGDFAFHECGSLEEVIIPRKTRNIGSLAFADCKNLKSLTIQDNVGFIGEGAFEGCPLGSVTIRNNPYAENYFRSHNITFNSL